jgi:hypothetical protein
MPRASHRKSPYDVHPGVVMVQNAMAKLKEKSGRDLDEWIAFIKKNGPSTETERRDWLKSKFGLGTNYAKWLAERADGKGEEDGDPQKYLESAEHYVEDMYAAAKAGLRPIHDKILELGRKLGKDVKVCPCKTIVPLYRNHVFAQIKPTTRTRIDLGFSLGNKKATGRLIDTGGFAKKDRITHRIPITQLSDIDDEVKGWLQTAYELDA